MWFCSKGVTRLIVLTQVAIMNFIACSQNKKIINVSIAPMAKLYKETPYTHIHTHADTHTCIHCHACSWYCYRVMLCNCWVHKFIYLGIPLVIHPVRTSSVNGCVMIDNVLYCFVLRELDSKVFYCMEQMNRKLNTFPRYVTPVIALWPWHHFTPLSLSLSLSLSL